MLHDEIKDHIDIVPAIIFKPEKNRLMLALKGFLRAKQRMLLKNYIILLTKLQDMKRWHCSALQD